MCAKAYQGFKAVQVRFYKECSSCHELFIKEHSIRHQQDNKPPGRTLFILNVPPYVTEDSLKRLFSKSGKVNSVTMQTRLNKDDDQTFNGFKVGYIVFSKREDLLKALSINSFSLDEMPFLTGLDKWVQEYNASICDPNQLSREIDSFMAKYDKTEVKKKKEKEVDDDGWTVVSKKGRKPGLARKESVEIKLAEKIKKGSKKKELTNFYTFQIREGKMKNLAVLRKKFEEAKKKVNLMKSSRRFKPY